MKGLYNGVHNCLACGAITCGRDAPEDAIKKSYYCSSCREKRVASRSKIHSPGEGNIGLIRAAIDSAVNTYPKVAPNTKQTNPKDVVGIKKVAMSCVSCAVLAEVGLGMQEGAAKYGRHNYRAVGVRASVYYDATLRHLFDWWEGANYDQDSTAKLHHVSKAITSLVVLRDSMIQGKCEDDRPPSSVKGWMQELNKEAKKVVEEHSDKKPKHYTINDVSSFSTK